MAIPDLSWTPALVPALWNIDRELAPVDCVKRIESEERLGVSFRGCSIRQLIINQLVVGENSVNLYSEPEAPRRHADAGGMSGYYFFLPMRRRCGQAQSRSRRRHDD